MVEYRHCRAEEEVPQITEGLHPQKEKTDDARCTAELEFFKHERKTLSTMIHASKDENFKRLCELVENDPWGYPYKIVMKKLNIRKQIPGLERLKSIVNTLFHTRATITSKIAPVSQEELDEVSFSPSNVAAVAKTLPNRKASGPDRISNEVLKVGLHPEYLVELFNNCIRGAIYPEI